MTPIRTSSLCGGQSRIYLSCEVLTLLSRLFTNHGIADHFLSSYKHTWSVSIRNNDYDRAIIVTSRYDASYLKAFGRCFQIQTGKEYFHDKSA